MELDFLKAFLLIAIAVIAIAFGLIPTKIHSLYAIQRRYKISEYKGQVALSLVTCFAGGVFLGVCLLDVLPETIETWKVVESHLAYSGDYPFVPLIIGIGLLLVWLLEEMFEKCAECKSVIPLDMSPSKIEDENQRMVRKISLVAQMHGSIETPIMRSITFIIAFVFHNALEGFAFGIQKDTTSVADLFFGIILHNAVVFFSIGVRLTRAHPTRPILVIALISFVALTSTVGGFIGLFVQDANVDHVSKDVVMLVLSCLSLGTFFFITFFELLGPEKSNSFPKMSQWIATSLGFGLIAVQMIFVQD